MCLRPCQWVAFWTRACSCEAVTASLVQPVTLLGVRCLSLTSRLCCVSQSKSCLALFILLPSPLIFSLYSEEGGEKWRCAEPQLVRTGSVKLALRTLLNLPHKPVTWVLSSPPQRGGDRLGALASASLPHPHPAAVPKRGARTHTGF